MSSRTSDLVRVLRWTATQIHQLLESETTDDASHRIREGAELVRVLSRIVEGQSLHDAFGAPGDWGYHSPIGRALLRHYSEDEK